MNDQAELFTEILRQGARALAGYASAQLLERHPETREGLEPDPLAGWQDWLAVRIDELAAAVSVGRPKLFVDQVRWGKAVLQSRGIPPISFRRGLECLRDVLVAELPKGGETLVAQYVLPSLEGFDEPSAEPSGRLLADSESGRLAVAYLTAVLEGDRQRAVRLILDALEHGHEIRSLHIDVLTPAQEELGRMWVANEINVAEEHHASQTTRLVMAQLLAHATIPRSNGKTMLAAAVAGNQHDLGLQTVADFFEMDGWRVIVLGANVPSRDLVEAVEDYSPDLLGLSVSQTTQFDAAKKAIRSVRGTARGTQVKILLGGHALPASNGLAEELGADASAADPALAVALGRRLVGLD
ncbi:MAG: cobalamin-dependent protein [Pirellulales bacterium]|nr:cobalamin-dependent protein [Pirellulales bacterium]